MVVVGKKTKDVLMQYGIIADLMPEEAGEDQSFRTYETGSRCKGCGLVL